jgi:hypothetical protein
VGSAQTVRTPGHSTTRPQTAPTCRGNCGQTTKLISFTTLNVLGYLQNYSSCSQNQCPKQCSKNGLLRLGNGFAGKKE